MKKTNNYIKYIKKISIMIVTLLLSFTIISQNTHAIDPIDVIPYGETLDDFTDFTTSYLYGTTYVVDTVIRVLNDDSLTYSRLLIRFRFENSNLYVDIYELDVEWVETPDNPSINGYYKSLLLGSKLVTNNIQWYNYRSLVFKVIDDNSSDTILDLVIYDIELGAFDFTSGNTLPNVTFNGLQFDTVKSEYSGVPLSQYFTIQVELLNDLYYFFTSAGSQEAYELGFSHGVIEGYGDGYQNGESVGYQNGLLDGMTINNREAYDKGYTDGTNDVFWNGFEKWIVPAIIIVLFLGGAITLIVRKREG